MIRYEVKNLIELREVAKALTDVLTAQGVAGGKAFDARLVVCELAGNVIKHARSTAWLEVELFEQELLVKVYAENGLLPPEGSVCPEGTAEGGRGLYLVDRLSAVRTVTEDGGVLVRIEL